jgi:hypothetical protein
VGYDIRVGIEKFNVECESVHVHSVCVYVRREILSVDLCVS